MCGDGFEKGPPVCIFVAGQSTARACPGTTPAFDLKPLPNKYYSDRDVYVIKFLQSTTYMDNKDWWKQSSLTVSCVTMGGAKSRGYLCWETEATSVPGTAMAEQCGRDGELWDERPGL